MIIFFLLQGAYILSPLEESSRDPEENAGFVITWLTRNQESRVTSYSVRNTASLSPPIAGSPSFGKRRDASGCGGGTQSFAAFKVLPVDCGGGLSCRVAVDDIVCRICEAGEGIVVSEVDVVSVEEARRVTSVYAQMEYGVKRLLWLGG